MKDQILIGSALDVLRTLPSDSIRACVTSPPYWGLRDYGVAGQIGLESLQEFQAKLVEVFEEVRRVLTTDGTMWLNLGDSFIAKKASGPQGKTGVRKGRTFTAKTIGKVADGLKPKDLVGVPWRIAFALQDAGWYLRSDVIWSKPNVIPESIKDRPCRAHEYLFLLAKSERYYYDNDAIREPYAPGSHARLMRKMQDTNARLQGRQPGRKYQAVHKGYTPNPLGRNRRSVWTIPTRAFSEAHFATFPTELITPCILASTAPGDTVLDPFLGAGTTGVVAQRYGRHYLGIELNPEYAEIARRRIAADQYQHQMRVR